MSLQDAPRELGSGGPRPARRSVKTGGRKSNREHGTGHARIRAAAEELVVERDGSLDVLELARRAGVSSSLLYRYYPSKDALLAAIVESFYDRYDNAVFNVPNDASLSYGQATRLRLEKMIAFHYSEPLAATVLGRLARAAETAAVDALRMSRHVDAAAAQVRYGQRIGALSPDLDPEVAGAMVIGGVHEALSRVLARHQRPAQEWLVNELWRLGSSALGLPPDA